MCVGGGPKKTFSSKKNCPAYFGFNQRMLPKLTISTYSVWKLFWPLNRYPDVAKNISEQYDDIKKKFRILKTEQKVKKWKDFVSSKLTQFEDENF